MGFINKPAAGSFPLFRKAASFLIFGICIVVSGCKSSEKIWSAEARSPDGNMLASARTDARSGFGTGYIGTVVYLNWTKGSQPPMAILRLSDDFEIPSEEISVEMKWLTPTHLELTYRGHRTLVLQAAKCEGVDISVRDLSTSTTNSSPQATDH
jgi:hypothetical protein